MDTRFLLTSQECEILLEFEQRKGLSELAHAMGKDISVVSRNLQAIAAKAELLEKHNGRWALTEKGVALNQWTREAIYAQKLAANKQRSLKIATTREFAARILLPQTRILVGNDDMIVSIISSDEGIEKLILSGQADFGFDCGRPQDPTIAFKRVTPEKFVLVAAPTFIKRYNIKNFEDARERDRLKFTRSEIVILDLEVESGRYFGTFSDIATLREACILGYGWAIFPWYTVVDELKAGKLSVIPGLKIEDEKYGVWWMRERQTLKPWVDRAIKWLKAQNLSD